MSLLRKLVVEAHRRSLWQVLAIYVAASWVVYEVIEALTSGLGLPEWFPALAVVLLLIGLPIVLATAFVQEGMPAARVERDPTLLPGGVPESGREAFDRRKSGARRWLTWRNALLGGLTAFAFWGLVAVGWLVMGGGLPASDDAESGAEISSTRVAVLPFSVRGGSEFEYLGEGIVNLLVTKLDGAGDLSAADPRGVLAAVGPAGGNRVDPARGRSIARRFGAGLYILGDILEVSGRLRIDASLYDATGDRETLARASAEGEADEVFPVVDQLAVRLLSEWGGGPDERLARVAAATTGSLPALKAYLAGERELRAGRFVAAVEAFQRAVEADTSFALAYYRLAVAAEWFDRLSLAREAVEQAARRSDRLAARDRRRVEAFRAQIEGAADEAERIYREILGTHPDDVEAWWQLGEVLFHQNPHRGRSIGESRAAWVRVLSLEPDHGPALVHLARVAALEGKAEELDSLVERGRRLGEDGRYERSLQLLRAFIRADAETQAMLAEELRGVDDHGVATAVWMVASFALNLEGGLKLARLETEATRSPSLQARGYLDRAHLELGLGRRAAAQEALDELALLNRRVALEHRALFATAPFLPVHEAELPDPGTELPAPGRDRPVPAAALRAILDSLGSWRTGAAGRSPVRVLVSPDTAAHREIGLYLSGVVSARLGDNDAALRRAEVLDSVTGPAEIRTLTHKLAQELRAEAAWWAGDADRAVAAFRRGPVGRETAQATNSAFYAGARGRWIRAEALRTAGRARAALLWYGTFAGHSNFDLIYLAPAHLRRAEIHESLGARQEAARHYRRFVELWADCDAELRPIVERAERRLAALDAG